MGNTRVTKVGVVERGKLQRCEALEDQKDCGSKLFKVQGGAGGRFSNFAPYLNRLIEGYGARYQPQVKVGVTSANAEPLSTREGEILRMTRSAQRVPVSSPRCGSGVLQ